MHGISCVALRQGDYVYLPKQGSCGFTVPASAWGEQYPRRGFVNSDVDSAGNIKSDAPPIQLYNLARDPRQTTNIAIAESQRAAAMQKRLHALIGK
jgi:hypothetical protein